MKKLLFWLLGTGLIASAAFHIAGQLMPKVIMQKAMTNLATEYKATPNAFFHSAPITAENQRIVRPSPDLAYSICLFDVSNGPVEVRVPKAANYLSVAFYDTGTNNFFHMNDSEMDAEGATIIINPSNTDTTPLTPVAYPGGRNVLTPTKTGLVLVRRVITDQDDWVPIEEERKQMSCAPYERPDA